MERLVGFTIRALESQLGRVLVQLTAAQARSAAATQAREKAETERDRLAARATALYRGKAGLEAEVRLLRDAAAARLRWWRRWWGQLLVVGLPSLVVGAAAGVATGFAVQRRHQRRERGGARR